MITRRNSEWSAGRAHKPRLARAIVVTLILFSTAAPPALAQFNSAFHGPNLNMGPRISINPNIRYSPNLNYEDVGGDQPRARPRRVYREGPPEDDIVPSQRTKKGSSPAVADNTYVPKEVLIEINGNPSDGQVEALARRYRLTRVQSQNLPTLNATFFRWRISDNRSVDDVVRELNAGGSVKSAQRNGIFRLQQSPQSSASTEKSLQQYALATLRLPQAHTLSVGANVRVAIIDSGIDVTHPEFSDAIESSFDALGSSEGAHAHGTSIAGIVASHQRLTGSAPSARLLAVRAFGAQKSGAESTSFVVLKGLDYAISHGAQVINMSFAGPKDAAIERGLAVASAKGIVLIAAAGNAGPKSPPLYPGADRNVIAVTATDSSDRLFTASNRGGYIAIAAPGVDILSALPDGKYGLSSGTSMSAAYVSGLAALMIARNPALTPGDLRIALANSARDLGPKGRDDQFGAGEADAFAAVSAIAGPIETASGRSGTP